MGDGYIGTSACQIKISGERKQNVIQNLWHLKVFEGNTVFELWMCLKGLHWDSHCCCISEVILRNEFTTGVIFTLYLITFCVNPINIRAVTLIPSALRIWHQNHGWHGPKRNRTMISALWLLLFILYWCTQVVLLMYGWYQGQYLADLCNIYIY